MSFENYSHDILYVLCCALTSCEIISKDAARIQSEFKALLITMNSVIDGKAEITVIWVDRSVFYSPQKKFKISNAFVFTWYHEIDITSCVPDCK